MEQHAKIGNSERQRELSRPALQTVPPYLGQKALLVA
jgi:hypothetical protein